MFDEEPTGVRNAVLNYIRIEEIGAGTYGTVYKCVDKRTKKMVAMKKVHFGRDLGYSLDNGIPMTTVREISLLRELEHPNIVKLVDIIIEEKRIFLIFEYLPSDLMKYLRSFPEGVLIDKTLQKSYLYQILQGVCYCHQRLILHRDLKPQNLLIDEHGVIKLADFGLAKTARICFKPCTREVATLWYRAPELLLGAERYSTAVDMWSIGCIFAEIATRKPLLQGSSEISQIFHIFYTLTTPSEETWRGVSKLPYYSTLYPCWKINRLQEYLGRFLDEDGMRILRGMLTYNPVLRISAKKLLTDKYFVDVDRSKLPAGDYDGSTLMLPTSQSQ